MTNRKRASTPPTKRQRGDVDFALVIASLQRAINANRLIAAVVFAAATGVGVVALNLLPELTDHSVAELERNSGDLMIGIFVLLRATAFAGLIVALFWGLLNLARAALDQATRYQKRLMAAHFMHFAFDEYRDRIGDDGFTLREIVNAIDAWSSNVESAYTKVKFGKGKSESWGISTQADGVKFAYGAEALRAMPADDPSDVRRRRGRFS